MIAGGRRYGIEFKIGDAPGTTRSMRTALADLGLEHLWIIYPGQDGYSLDERISVLPLARIAEKLGPFQQSAWRSEQASQGQFN